MTEPVTVAVGPCVVHGGLFEFDPDAVPAVLIDPVTGRPPDVDEFSRPRTPTDEERSRSAGQPYCPPCARKMNGMLRERGLEPKFDETDTAAALRE